MEEKGTRVASEEVQNIYFNFYKDLTTKVFDFSEETFVDEVFKVPLAIHVEKLEITKGKLRPWLEFDEEAVRCAYILRYSVLNTISVAEHFSEAVTFGSEITDKFLTDTTLKIVCFGGGAGTEIVGIVKTINDYLNQGKEESRAEPLQICFTVFDQCEDWQAWTTSLVKHLRYDGNMCCKRNVDVRLRFFAVNLIAKWDENTGKAVKKADILTMVRFVSTYCESMSEKAYEQKRDLKLFSKIAVTMKLGARLFFLDYGGGGSYHKVEKHYDKCQFMEKILTNLHQSHLVNICSEDFRTCIPVHKEMLGKHNTKISSCLWLKRVPEARVVKTKIKKLPNQKKTKDPLEKFQKFPVH